MKPVHQQFVAQLTKELSKKNITFDQFLRNVNLEKLAVEEKGGSAFSKSSKSAFTDKDGDVITKLTSVDVVFGRGNNIAKHPGNWLFRQAVGLNKAYYADLYRELKSVAARRLVDEFVAIGTRFLEEINPPKGTTGPAFRRVERPRVIEKFCQGMREKKFSASGLVPVAKKKAVLLKKGPQPTRNSKRTAKKKKDDDDDDDGDDEWTPKGKSQKKKATEPKAAVVTIGTVAKNTEAPSAKKDKKKGKVKAAKKQKETKVKKKSAKGKASASSTGKTKVTKDTKDKPKKKSPKPPAVAPPAPASGELKTPSPKASKSSKVSPTKPLSSSSTTKSSTNGVASEPRRRNYEGQREGGMPTPWTSSYSGPHFYPYPHYPPYFYPPEHYARMDPRYNNNRRNDKTSDSSENPQPAAVTPDVAPHPFPMPMYPDPRIITPMELETLPNTIYWRKRVRLDNSRRNDKEVLAAFMESYEDCKKYAHEMCKTHQETVVERFPVDDEAENLVRVLRPSKLRKLSADKVSPMPVFHDS